MSRRYSDDRTTVILNRSVSQRQLGPGENPDEQASVVTFNQQLGFCDKVQNGLTIFISYFLIYIFVLFVDWGNGLEMAGAVVDLLDPTNSLPNFINTTGNRNQSTMFHWLEDSHKEWGVMSILVTFVPGIMYSLANIFSYILGSNSIFQKPDQDEPPMYMIGLKATGLMFFYPLYVCYHLLRTIFSQNPYNCKLVLTVISMTAFLQSAPQLLLQFHTICNGQRPTCMQIVCIFTSFYFLIKTAIEYHIGAVMFFDLSFTDKLIKTLKLLPLYVTCLFFRIGTLAIITTHFNWWAIIPFLITIIIISTIAKKNGHNDIDALLAGPINLFTMAAGNKQNTDISSQDKKKFYQISTVAIFFIYSILLVTFLVVWSLVYKGSIDESNFNIEYWKMKIFYKEDIAHYGMYVVCSAILFAGLLNLTFLFIDTGHELEIITTKSEAGKSHITAAAPKMEMTEQNNHIDAYEYNTEINYNRDSFADSRDGLDDDDEYDNIQTESYYQNV